MSSYLENQLTFTIFIFPEIKYATMFDSVPILFVVFGLLFHQYTHAQGELSIEFNGGPSFTNDEPVQEVDLKTGISLEGVLHYELLPYLGLYGGWGWTRFPSEEVILSGVSIGQATFREVGYRLGLEFNQTFGDSRYGIHVRGGGLWTQIQAETESNILNGESDYTFDWQAAVGLTVNLMENLQLRPGFRYHYIKRELEYENLLDPTEVDVTYSVITLAVVYNLKPVLF